MASPTNFNLITEAEALAALDKIDDLNGGVRAQIDGSRAYVPSFGGGFAPPSDGDNKMYWVEFMNGKTVGLGVVHYYLTKYTAMYRDPNLALQLVRQIVENN